MVVRSNLRRAAMGLWAGFLIAVAVLFYSAYLIMNGHAVPGTVVVVADLAALVSVFVYGTNRQRLPQIPEPRDQDKPEE